MTVVNVTSTKIGDGKGPATAFRPQFNDDYPNSHWQDITGVSITPKVQVLDAASIAAVQVDVRYAGKVTVVAV
jgi:hypothetical protein